jgi:hypothetical protein
MTATARQVPLETPRPQRPPGFLFSPFGWAAESIIVLLQSDATLLTDLIYLTHVRMHLVALALAHVEGDIGAALGRTLFRGSAGDILDVVVGNRPIGLKRVVQCLPRHVLEAESYRRLVQLLDDPAASKLLYHAGEIDDEAIRIIDNIPVALRSVVFAMQPWFRGMDSLGDGLRYLVRRGGAQSFDALVANLAHIRQPEQLIGKIKSIVQALPLPEALPPAHVEQARRIDDASELRKLAKQWRNCLETYIWRVDGGESAIYLWEDAELQAVCAVRRRARLGWFLEQIKGPRNSEIESPHLETIRNAFDDAGVPPYSTIRAVEDIVDMAGMRGLRRRLRRQMLPAEQLDEELFRDMA